MSTNPIIISNIAAIQDGLIVLHSIDVDHYRYIDQPAFSSSVGSHFRHVIEHYRCFLSQLEKQEICYDDRQREVCLEADLHEAVKAFKELEAQFEQLNSNVVNQTCVLRDGISDKLVPTTVARELLFLQAHTVHHYAIIGAMLKKQGITLHKSFGVATATLVHEKALQNIAHEGKKICAQ